ncbi:MAG: Ig-like domain-containing protein, partial [Cardiobacteriaceae bacterium]|nr:Ig-like domain-containing protein [Cardiobacteriaceae bacterium]
HRIQVENDKFTDLAGNPNQDGADADNTVNFTVADTTAPTVAITAAKTNLSVGEKTVVTFTFSEPVKDFVLGDITVKGGTVSKLQPGPGNTYTVEFTATTAGAHRIQVENDKFTDLAGNPNRDGADADNTLNFMINTRPVATGGSSVVEENAVGKSHQIQLQGTDAESKDLTYKVSTVTATSSKSAPKFTVTPAGTNEWTITSTIAGKVRTGTLRLDPNTGKLILNEGSEGPEGRSVFDSLPKGEHVDIKVGFSVNDGASDSNNAVQTIKITGINDVARVSQSQRVVITVNSDAAEHTARGDRSIFDVDHGEEKLITFDDKFAGTQVTDLRGLYGSWSLAEKTGGRPGVDWVYTVDPDNIAVKSMIASQGNEPRLADHLNILSLDRSAALSTAERQMPSAIISSEGVDVTTTKLAEVATNYTATADQDGLHVQGNVNANINMGNSDDALFVRGNVGGYTIDMGEDIGKDYAFLQNLSGTAVKTGAGSDVVTVYGSVGNASNINMGAGDNDTLLLFKDVLIDNSALTIQGVDRLDMRNGDFNTITITGEAIVANGETNLHIIAGDRSDAVRLSGTGFTDNGDGTYSYSSGGKTYTIHDEMHIGFTIV